MLIIVIIIIVLLLLFYYNGLLFASTTCPSSRRKLFSCSKLPWPGCFSALFLLNFLYAPFPFLLLLLFLSPSPSLPPSLSLIMSLTFSLSLSFSLFLSGRCSILLVLLSAIWPSLFVIKSSLHNGVFIALQMRMLWHVAFFGYVLQSL